MTLFGPTKFFNDHRNQHLHRTWIWMLTSHITLMRTHPKWHAHTHRERERGGRERIWINECKIAHCRAQWLYFTRISTFFISISFYSDLWRNKLSSKTKCIRLIVYFSFILWRWLLPNIFCSCFSKNI